MAILFHQVLVQGWQVTQDNLAEFLAAIRKQLQLLEDTIAEVSALAYDQLEALRIRQVQTVIFCLKDYCFILWYINK